MDTPYRKHLSDSKKMAGVLQIFAFGINTVKINMLLIGRVLKVKIVSSVC